MPLTATLIRNLAFEFHTPTTRRRATPAELILSDFWRLASRSARILTAKSLFENWDRSHIDNLGAYAKSSHGRICRGGSEGALYLDNLEALLDASGI